jgi:hypothetical protein
MTDAAALLFPTTSAMAPAARAHAANRVNIMIRLSRTIRPSEGLLHTTDLGGASSDSRFF